ncbi:MAG: glycerophosphodiester phosphodiesterase [Mycobacteriales bacterium]
MSQRQVHGHPQNGKVGDAGYTPYTTRTMVDAAHARGMRVIAWTVDDVPTMQSLIDIGVDGLITDYPDRLRALMADNGFKLPMRYPAR